MQSFIHEVATLLLAEHPGDLDRVLVVFNNRRPTAFLRKELAAEGAKQGLEAFFLPEIVGMNDLIALLGKLEIIPNEFLIFELYNIRQKLEAGQEGHETAGFSDYSGKGLSIEQFMPLADAMLADFSEVDLYMADAARLFDNLHQLKAIGEWDVEGAQLTPFQRRYLSFYRSLLEHYNELRGRLLAKGKAYSGMAYRHAAENIEALADSLPYDEVYFAGFNALSASELTIIRALLRRGKARLLTDGDTYYVDNPLQEAGFFLRKLRGMGLTDTQYPSFFGQETKKITIVASQGDVLQAKYAASLLREGNAADTALVLADEKLLLPVLNSLPDGLRTANISMGFPLDQSLSHNLCLGILSLYEHASFSAESASLYYHTDIENLLASPLIGANVSKFKRALAEKHIIRASMETLSQMWPDIDRIAFLLRDTPPAAKELPAIVKAAAQKILGSGRLQEAPQEEEALNCLLETMDYMESLFDADLGYNPEILNCRTFKKIYIRIAKRRKVSFIGEPLSGLQILGMLEARNLDFSRIILLSANEGVLPSRRNDSSLIPLTLKRAFGLPTYKEKDAVYANHFYSLLQRAGEVWLVHTTPAEGVGKTEESRFVAQVREELAPTYPDKIVLKEISLAFRPAGLPHATDTVKIKNTDSGQSAAGEGLMELNLENLKEGLVWEEILRAATEKGLSPSALNRYRSCPMRWCYESLLKLKDDGDISDALDASDLGTMVHNALYDIYSPMTGQFVDTAWLRRCRENAADIIRTAGEHLFTYGRERVGRNLYCETIAVSLVRHMLEKEIGMLEAGGHTVKIIGCEMPIEAGFETATGMKVKIRGIADRVDLFDGVDRIIDYKTGSVDMRKLNVKSNCDAADRYADDKCFQVLLYAWARWRGAHNGDAGMRVMSGIYPLRRTSDGLALLTIDGNELISADGLRAFEDYMRELVGGMLDKSVPFARTPSDDGCRYCAMGGICYSSSRM